MVPPVMEPGNQMTTQSKRLKTKNEYPEDRNKGNSNDAQRRCLKRRMVLPKQDESPGNLESTRNEKCLKKNVSPAG
ncbi:hypothetical protein AVEN_120230-1 [Araneus ventricosus]|uniref:Uncharacterized protein n=1 Tax=Araneus ventricosus TaxID=182803 RepID=A0A4Y2RN38_ARAVE|nr:hypothetical protein AVEN_120230-1 [Araneus ventricosus]